MKPTKVQVTFKRDHGFESIIRTVIQETSSGFYVHPHEQPQWESFGLPKAEWFPKQSKMINSHVV